MVILIHYILLFFVFCTFTLHFMLIALSTVATVNIFTFHSEKKIPFVTDTHISGIDYCNQQVLSFVSQEVHFNS